MIYFISDTHFGHKGSLHWPNGNKRIFDSVDHMNQVMVDNWNSVVSNNDLVYHLGDFSYKTSTNAIIHIMESLNGKIILLKGNHDGQTLKANSKIHRFESVHDRVEFEYNNQYFVLDHYPIWSWNHKFHGAIHLHGHIHGEKSDISGNILNISCEMTGYRPLSIIEVMNRFNDVNTVSNDGVN